MQEVRNQDFADRRQEQLDKGSALQTFLNRIPISSIPGIKNSSVVELKTGDSVKDAIQLLYENNVSGAPIVVEVRETDAFIQRISDRHMGYIDIASLVLWSLEECGKPHGQSQENSSETHSNESGKCSIISMLEQNPEVGQTKIGELAKAFLWEPFFPVNMEETLFHVLLLLSKHPLHVVPVVEQPDSQVTGFVTQDAVLHLLLQSRGLEWFDSISDKALSEFPFKSEEKLALVYGDQSLAEALHVLWEKKSNAVAVVNRKTGRIDGCISSRDIYLLLENNNRLSDRERITADVFIQTETADSNTDPTIDKDLGALLSVGGLRLKNNYLPLMTSPVTAKKNTTLKQVMKDIAATKSSFSFIVDESGKPVGILTLREIINQFAPPCVDSSIHGGGFFDSALEQTGCQVRNGTIIPDH